MNTKRLSIIIPVYNVEKYLRTCLLSILEQAIHKSEYEIIIVNDGSTDKSIDSIADLVAAYPKVFIILNQTNQGPSAARNKALKYACGKFIMFIDSDDGIKEGTLHFLLECAEKKDVDMLRFGYQKINDENFSTKGAPSQLPQQNELKVISGQKGLLFHNTRECYIWLNLFRREFLLNNNLLFEPNLYFEDIPYTIACYLKAYRFLNIPIQVYMYRQHSSSILGSMNVEKLISLNSAIKLTHELKNSNPISIEVLQKIDDTVFDSLSLMLWYLVHYRNLYARKNYVLHDLKQKMPNLWFSHGIKQTGTSLCVRLCPHIFITVRRFFSKKNY